MSKADITSEQRAGKNFQANGSKKEADVSIFIFNKTHFKHKLRYREIYKFLLYYKNLLINNKI